VNHPGASFAPSMRSIEFREPIMQSVRALNKLDDA